MTKLSYRIALLTALLWCLTYAGYAQKLILKRGYYFLDATENYLHANLGIGDLALRSNAFTVTTRSWRFDVPCYPWIAHATTTVFDSTDPPPDGRSSTGSMLNNPANTSIATLLDIDPSEGNYKVSVAGAAYGAKEMCFNFEPANLTSQTPGSANDIKSKYPYTEVPDTFDNDNYFNQLPSNAPNDTARDFRLEVVGKMHQHFANALIPYAIEPALDPSTPQYGARVGAFDWPSSLQGETNNIRHATESVAQDWIDRQDRVFDLRVQYPPPSYWLDEGGYYTLPPGKTAADYAFVNTAGPDGGHARLIDLFEMTGGAYWPQMYVQAIHNMGTVQGFNWDDAMILRARRMFTYYADREIPVVIFARLSPLGTLTAWAPGVSITNTGVTNARRAVYPVASGGDDQEHDWLPATAPFTTSATFAEDLALNRWTDKGLTGRMIREEIMRPVIAELRYRYGNRWAIFSNNNALPAYATDAVPFLQIELARPVMTSLDDLKLEPYGEKPYNDGDASNGTENDWTHPETVWYPASL